MLGSDRVRDTEGGLLEKEEKFYRVADKEGRKSIFLYASKVGKPHISQYVNMRFPPCYRLVLVGLLA